jgi:DNA-binding PadR family transcriptional regulator
MRPEQTLLHGPALAAVLKLLARGPQDGYQLTAQLRASCPPALSLGEASVYAVLYYLEAQRLVSAAWSETDGPRQRTYTLTQQGRERLADQCRQWEALQPLFADRSNSLDADTSTTEAAT